MLKALLRRVPQGERDDAVREIIAGIGDNGVLDVGLSTSIYAELSDDTARQIFQDRLLDLLESGKAEPAVAVTAQENSIGHQLVQAVAQRLHGLACRLQHTPDADIVVSMAEVLPKQLSRLSTSEIDPAKDCMMKCGNLLLFLRSASLQAIEEETFDGLFGAVILLLGSSDKAVCVGAREVLVGLSGVASYMTLDRHNLVWLCLQKLIAQQSSPYHQMLGYSIWLRWVRTSDTELHHLFDATYWELLQHGLRFGDTECRKMCLAILRRSVTVAANTDASMASIFSAHDGSTGREAVIAQYERFCTVCETMLLGRYLNQILDCEQDLSFVASSASIVKAEWLYTLLASVLHPKMQDANRKFVGNWVIRCEFQPNASEDFVAFLRSAFLPWAVQGSLFTSTLRKGTSPRCGHGDRLAQYFRSLLTRNASNSVLSSQLIDLVLDVLSARRSFAYANVYLLEGLARAHDEERTLEFDIEQAEKVAALSSWTALPEVAQDYVFVRSLKLCGDNLFRTTEGLRKDAVAKAVTRWNQIQAMLDRFPNEPLPAGSIASWSVEPSNRDIRENAALDWCHELRNDMRSAATLDIDMVHTKLLEIWNELEYLEYPKTLLLAFPSILLNPMLVELGTASTDLGKTVADLVSKLQALTANRVYLMWPLVCVIRLATMTVPSAAGLLNLESVISSYAESLPGPTVDLRLEDAAAKMLQSVVPALEVFSYDYYFGPRETIGAAALLDLASRLGKTEPEILVSLLNTILDRWASQSTSPSTGSSSKSTLQLQLAVLCCEQVLPHLDVEHALKRLHHILSIENLPRHRYLLGWIVARIYLKRNGLKIKLITDLTSKDHHSNPKYLAAIMKICVMLAQVEGATADFALQLATAMIPLAASSKVIIRHEAQWQFPSLMRIARSKGWQELTHNVAFTALDEHIRSLERFEQPPLERLLDRFDPVKDHTLTNLVEGSWYGLDTTQAPLCRRADFVELYRRDAQTTGDWPAPCIPLGPPVVLPEEVEAVTTMVAAETSLPDNPGSALGQIQSIESRALQTKGTAYTASADMQDGRKRAMHAQLIMVASLVDNPYNLGGLSRVSEVFGASELLVQNQRVTSNKDFQATAVSSHLHLPLVELSSPDIAPYLTSKRNEGWAIVGIEQTDRSVVLGSEQCKLPQQIVLVVGSEKEGIPALVLSECDMLVEIPQHGVTRSLNVQTAAAIVLYEYSRQHSATSTGK
ncbi:hypothetical protein LTR22_008891 [Elasticomyces elasticus]|nr:hypothetical protein LTR22_008891 [Elasticomyces elasticus]KAK5761903.1 hypothetical protein LTS12_007966 [Elasticomyces elasticus]